MYLYVKKQNRKIFITNMQHLNNLHLELTKIIVHNLKRKITV